MAVNAPTAAEAAAARAASSPDILWMFERERVTTAVQDHLLHGGVSSCRMLGAMAASADDLRTTLRTAFNLDPTNFVQRLDIARIVLCWEQTRAQNTRFAELDAESAARREPKQLAGSVVVSMRRAYETRYRRLENVRAPARVYLERISDQVEKQEFRAEKLSDAH